MNRQQGLTTFAGWEADTASRFLRSYERVQVPRVNLSGPARNARPTTPRLRSFGQCTTLFRRPVARSPPPRLASTPSADPSTRASIEWPTAANATVLAMKTSVALALLALLALSSACDRRIEPFVPGELPREPDLSEIFPAGAERAARPSAGLPPPPGQSAAAPVAAAPDAAATSAAPISGTVRLASALSGRVPHHAVS